VSKDGRNTQGRYDTMTEDDLNALKAEVADLQRRLKAGQDCPCQDISDDDIARIAKGATDGEKAVLIDMADEQSKGTDPRYRGEDRMEVAVLLAVDWIFFCSQLVEMRRPGLPYEEHVRLVQELYGSPLLSIGLGLRKAKGWTAESN
jgi:hypothetical protein